MYNDRLLEVHFLERITYDAAYRLQRDLWKQRVAGNIPDQLLLLEHYPVITIGRNARRENLLADEDRLRKIGVDLRKSDRGGDVTYHGPGQLVGYPILDLQPDRMDVLKYLRDLELVLIKVLAEFDIKGEQIPNYTGVWVNEEKIASIGVKISRWVTYHGFALNVSPDLAAFKLIIPCGIANIKMTSIERQLGRAPEISEVAQLTAIMMGEVFCMTPQKSNELIVSDFISIS